MLAAHNARERTVSDFVRLFEEASPRFLLKGVTSGAEAGSFNSLLEFEFR
jgi:6-hydroxytryprostatin B O-methyltransferase